MISALFSRLIILSFGTLYPAYSSYKAVRTKNVKEYVKWMMYWIVYAFFTCIETFTDIFLSWFPFYYEIKVIIVVWLLSPATKGSSTLYRKFVHPMLTRREQEIDDYLNQAKERGYSAVIQLGSKGVNYATNVIMQTALKGGGNLVQTIRRSYSLSDLSEPDVHRTQDELDEVIGKRSQQRMLRPRMPTAVGRSSSGTRHSTGMYFTEVDVSSNGSDEFNYSIRSSEDISSGYSSPEPLSVGLSRTSSMTNASRTRMKSKRSEENEYLWFESTGTHYPYQSKDRFKEDNYIWQSNAETVFVSNKNKPKNQRRLSISPRKENQSYAQPLIEEKSLEEEKHSKDNTGPESIEEEGSIVNIVSTSAKEEEHCNDEHKSKDNECDLKNEDNDSDEFFDALGGDGNPIEKTNEKIFSDEETETKNCSSEGSFPKMSENTSEHDIAKDENLEIGFSNIAEVIPALLTGIGEDYVLEEPEETVKPLKDRISLNAQKLSRNKGRAPNPPTHSTNYVNPSSLLTETKIPVPKKSNLFSSIKSNIFRTIDKKNIKPSAEENGNILPSVNKETEI